MSDGFSVEQIMNVAAYGLGLGTLFFSFFGIRAERDFFLMMGLVACVAGNVMFAIYLHEQTDDEAGRNNETMATMYIMFSLLSVYAIYRQFEGFRENGCFDEDEDDEDEVPTQRMRPGERPLRPLNKPLALPAPAADAKKKR